MCRQIPDFDLNLWDGKYSITVNPVLHVTPLPLPLSRNENHAVTPKASFLSLLSYSQKLYAVIGVRINE